MTESSPLKWPNGWPRNQKPEISNFKPGSIHQGGVDITRELELMGARNVVINSNMQYRQDGLPYTRQNVTDTGVAVYFTLKGKQQCVPCDRWVRLEENMRAIAKTIDALRGIERWGAKEMVDAAFEGFKALPSGSGNTIELDEPWNVTLGILSNASPEEIKVAFMRLSHLYHPDKPTGNTKMFQKINEAYKKGLNQ